MRGTQKRSLKVNITVSIQSLNGPDLKDRVPAPGVFLLVWFVLKGDLGCDKGRIGAREWLSILRREVDLKGGPGACVWRI